MAAKKPVAAVVAATSHNFGIGKNGGIPWKIPEDMALFKRITTETGSANTAARNAVIMGRRTWESIPAKFRPLPNRLNVVLSGSQEVRRSLDLPPEVVTASSLDEALVYLNSEECENVPNIFIIGGENAYREAIQRGLCTKVYLTLVETVFEGLDVFFPTLSATQYQMIRRSPQHTENDVKYRFLEFDKIDFDDTVIASAPPAVKVVVNAEEQQYLDAVSNILRNGVRRGDRTGTGTVSIFGMQMRFSLRDDVFPLLTTKRVFWRGVAEELLWFVKGSTDANELVAKDIHIWDGNASREFLDKRGLTDREEGDLGPVYGFQWRHFGAPYTNMHADYKGCGIDQLQECITKIKSTPEDRRIIMTAWNPADLDKMALPPCHMFAQFYVANGELSCQMYQRSADMGLGVPFNIASYSLLTRMMAQVCGLKAGEFVHTIGDAHIYLNHVESLTEQITRTPTPFPKLFIESSITDIEGFEFSHFHVEGYSPQAAIKMKMAV